MAHLEEEEASHEQKKGSIARNIRQKQSPPPSEKQDLEHEEDPPSFNKTLTGRDINMMRANSYQNISFFRNKKHYQCEMCDFKAPLFANLKTHLRKTHLENESQILTKNTNGKTMETNAMKEDRNGVSTSLDDSPKMYKSRSKSKSPVKKRNLPPESRSKSPAKKRNVQENKSKSPSI